MDPSSPPSGRVPLPRVMRVGVLKFVFVRRILYQSKKSLQVQHRARNWTGRPTVSRPHPSSSHPVARSPSGKAKVCKTFIGGSIPPRASNLRSSFRIIGLI